MAVVLLGFLLAPAQAQAPNIPYAHVQGDCLDNFVWGCPVSRDCQSGDLLLREALALYYNPETEWADWVVSKFQAQYFDPQPRLDWKTDPWLDEKYAIHAGSGKHDEFGGMYKGGPEHPNSYDRGHQIPDASWQSAPQDVKVALAYYSNITPQKSQLNEGLWEELESRVMRLTREKGVVYVYTGPLTFKQMEKARAADKADAYDHKLDYSNCKVRLPYLNRTRWTLSGKGSAPNYLAPSGYWKIIIVPEQGNSSAWTATFIMGQDTPYDEASILPYLWDVHTIEGLTGIDFFPELSRSTKPADVALEKHLEHDNNYDLIRTQMNKNDHQH